MPRPFTNIVSSGPGLGIARPGPPGPPGAPGFQAGQDLSGTTTAQTVVGIQNRNVDSAAPSIGDAYLWDGAQWAPGPAGGGGSVAPLTNVFYVDQNTSTPGASQDGSIAAPFDNLQDALDAVTPPGSQWNGMIIVAPGTYSEAVSVSASFGLWLTILGLGSQGFGDFGCVHEGTFTLSGGEFGSVAFLKDNVSLENPTIGIVQASGVGFVDVSVGSIGTLQIFGKHFGATSFVGGSLIASIQPDRAWLNVPNRSTALPTTDIVAFVGAISFDSYLITIHLIVSNAATAGTITVTLNWNGLGITTEDVIVDFPVDAQGEVTYIKSTDISGGMPTVETSFTGLTGSATYSMEVMIEYAESPVASGP